VNLSTLLTNTAGRTPNHPAIRSQGQAVTYAQLSHRVDSLAAGLSAAGLKPGDVCVLMMPNSINWVTTYYALAKLGSVVLPINFLYRVGELQHIFRDSGARALIGHTAYLEEARKVMTGLPAMDIRVADGGPAAGFTPLEALFANHGVFPTYPAQDDEPLAMIYTSGTTGLPKGAVLTHKNLASQRMWCWGCCLSFTSTDRRASLTPQSTWG
jgi:long-chain acyl-CoA synthetase